MPTKSFSSAAQSVSGSNDFRNNNFYSNVKQTFGDVNNVDKLLNAQIPQAMNIRINGTINLSSGIISLPQFTLILHPT